MYRKTQLGAKTCAYVSSNFSYAPAGDPHADEAEDAQVRDVDELLGADLAGRERSQQVDAVVQRRRPDHPLEPVGIGREREERGREEEHRQDRQVEDVEVLPAAHVRDRGDTGAGECEPDEHRRRHRQERPPRLEQPERCDHGEEADGVDQAAEERERRLAGSDVLVLSGVASTAS